MSGCPFDPWIATEHEALDAHLRQGLAVGEPGPYAQWRAATDVEASRQAYAGADGGRAVMYAMAACAKASLVAPAWLADEFARRVARVQDAWEATWDGAFGRPWPSRTKLHSVRERRRLLSLVHAAVFKLAQEPNAALNRTGIFTDVAQMPGINRSPSSVEKLYYDAVKDGLLDVACWRESNSLPRERQNAWDYRNGSARNDAPTATPPATTDHVTHPTSDTA